MSLVEFMYFAFAVGCLIALRREQHKRSRLMNKFEEEIYKNRQFKASVRRLIWNIGNQREKVPANLITVVKTMGDSIQYNEEESWEIKNKVMENIK